MAKNDGIPDYTGGTEENPFEGLSQQPPGRYDVRYGKYTYTVTVREDGSFVNFNLAGKGATHGTNASSTYDNDNYRGIDVTISNGNGNFSTSSASNSAQAAILINEEFGTSNKNTTYIGYSLNGVDAARLAGDHANAHPEEHNPFVVSIEPSTNSTASQMAISESQRQGLIDSDALVFSAHNYNFPLRNLAGRSSYNGVHMIDMSVTIRDENGKPITNGHKLIEQYLYQAGISDIGSGNFYLRNDPGLEYKEFTYEGKKYRVNVEEIKFKEYYIDENGEYQEREITLAEVNNRIFAQNWAAKFGKRIELPTNINDEDRDFYSTVLRCDNAYLADWLATTYSAVSVASADIKQVNVSVKSTVNVASKEAIIVGQIGSIQKNLINKFKGELKAIAAVGTTHRETDRTLQQEEQELLEV